MNGSWGVYEVCGRLPGGKETTVGDRAATRFFVRWRVDGRMRRRTFETKTHARQWRETLIAAKHQGWSADERGWPVHTMAPAPQVVAEAAPGAGDSADGASDLLTVETYVNEVWWPAVSVTLGDKSRIGHRRNADLAVKLLRVVDGDPHLRRMTTSVGDSLPVRWWTSDHTKSALAARRCINGRTAAKNARLLAASVADNGPGIVELTLEPEQAAPATMRNFWLTLNMIAASAVAAGLVTGDPMADTASHAPKPRASRRSDRLVPSLDELFDIADAISLLGPMMQDGRPCGARFRSLVLCGGTTGPRPGELAAHRPEWFDWDNGPAEIRFHRTEAAVYGAVLLPEERGRRVRPLKHQAEDEFRPVPLIGDVAAAIREHFERGYSSPDRTWLSPSGRGHVDFGNLTSDYWRPAMHRVFAGTKKDALATAPPKILRKTAITWWADSGINQAQAAEWAGHSEEVARLYYASRASTTFAREAALLETSRVR